MNNEQARAHIKRGANDPAYRSTREYQDAMRHTTAHYRGLYAAAADQQSTGSGGSTKKSCGALWVFAVVLGAGWPLAFGQAFLGWVSS